VQFATLGHHVRFMIRAGETTRALKENQQQLVTAQRLASLGYWRWHVHTGTFEVSRHFLGDETISRVDSLDAFAACVIDEDRPAFLADIGRALEEATTLETSYRMHWGDRLMHIHQHLSRDVQRDIHGHSKAVLVGTIQDVTARRQAEEQVRRLAYYDALTGLASRTFLYERIGEMIRSARRRKIGFTLLFLDLDGFKDVNDTQGHSAGDVVLKEVATRLVASVRDNDFVARFGGDEFCILLEDLEDEMDIRMIANRCLEHVTAPFEVGQVTMKPRTSIGIARYPFDADDLNGLLRAADSAMYEAKANGKHRFEYYDAAMTARAEQRFLLAQQLREALVQNQFEMYYQPQVSLANGTVIGFEALARWNHPERGLLPPSEFISELAHLKLINDFETWAVQHVCTQIAQWQQQGVEVPIAVNISAEHFRKSALPAIVEAALAAAGVIADRLVLEVTESAMQYTDEAIQVLHALRNMGVKVAIDDFGTGFSSLGSLQHLPVQYIKIDRLFIRDLTEAPKDAIMLGTIVTLAHALGFNIIAEGVENTAQIQILSGLDCDTVQGFFFSRPIPAAEVPAMAAHRFVTSLEQQRLRATGT
jgi:diguanylate cyclase (GGDEF)-like protein